MLDLPFPDDGGVFGRGLGKEEGGSHRVGTGANLNGVSVIDGPGVGLVYECGDVIVASSYLITIAVEINHFGGGEAHYCISGGVISFPVFAHCGRGTQFEFALYGNADLAASLGIVGLQAGVPEPDAICVDVVEDICAGGAAIGASQNNFVIAVARNVDQGVTGVMSGDIAMAGIEDLHSKVCDVGEAIEHGLVRTIPGRDVIDQHVRGRGEFLRNDAVRISRRAHQNFVAGGVVVERPGVDGSLVSVHVDFPVMDTRPDSFVEGDKKVVPAAVSRQIVC